MAQAPLPRMIFVNLPVTDLERARAFYEALGFTVNPMFSDETAYGMVWSDTIYLMLLNHQRWAGFTARPIPDPGSSEVMLCLSCESAEEVLALTAKAGPAGGISDVNPGQDLGFMVGRSVADPDGHVWEFTWMDPRAATGEISVHATT